MTGCPVRCPASYPGGIGGDGCSDVAAARGDVGCINLGVGNGACDEGDGMEGGRRGVGLVGRMTNICKIRRIVALKKSI